MNPPSINKPLAIIAIACVFSFIAVFLSMCRGLAQVADEFDRTRVSTTGNNSPAIGTIHGNFDPSTITETQAVSVSGNLVVGSSSTASTIQMQNVVGTYSELTNTYTFSENTKVIVQGKVLVDRTQILELVEILGDSSIAFAALEGLTKQVDEKNELASFGRMKLRSEEARYRLKRLVAEQGGGR